MDILVRDNVEDEAADAITLISSIIHAPELDIEGDDLYKIYVVLGILSEIRDGDYPGE